MKYLDPRTDLTFKKVFGEHKDVVKSFLNAMLPLADDEQIEEIEYQTPELLQVSPEFKNSIVDVCCVDSKGRQFIVEMQFVWSREFYKRVVFNASKAYVRQADKSFKYKDLKPVYSLNIINTTIDSEIEGYYHHYRIVHHQFTDKIIEGLQFVFVELPKFNPSAYNDKKMQVLWLRYLTEIGEETTTIPPELLEVSEVKKAIDTLEIASLTKAERNTYDKFWDAVRVESAVFDEGHDKGIMEGIEKGIAVGKAEGIAVGKAEGKAEANKETAKILKSSGISPDVISLSTGLSINEIELL